MGEQKKRESGITLIALIISIIVLLILAGVSISALVGENGILNQAVNGADRTNIAKEIEILELAVSGSLNEDLSINGECLRKNIENGLGNNNFDFIENEDGTFLIKFKERWYDINTNGEVTESVNWDLAKLNAKAPEEQLNQEVVGIGTDGKPVNMDLWNYSLDVSTTGYGLNSFEVLNNSENGGTNNERITGTGYKGKIINGEIEGKIPQYIKESDGEWIPVTSLYRTFENLDIITAPKIPSTVAKMNCTFEMCSYLESMPTIPYGVESMNWTFCLCINLKNISNISNSVKSMRGTFAYCTSLVSVPEIPSSVEDCQYTFSSCSNLTGVLILNANLSNELDEDGNHKWFCILDNAATNENCYIILKGTCPMLETIATSYSYFRDNIILQK